MRRKLDKKKKGKIERGGGLEQRGPATSFLPLPQGNGLKAGTGSNRRWPSPAKTRAKEATALTQGYGVLAHASIATWVTAARASEIASG